MAISMIATKKLSDRNNYLFPSDCHDLCFSDVCHMLLQLILDHRLEVSIDETITNLTTFLQGLW